MAAAAAASRSRTSLRVPPTNVFFLDGFPGERPKAALRRAASALSNNAPAAPSRSPLDSSGGTSSISPKDSTGAVIIPPRCLAAPRGIWASSKNGAVSSGLGGRPGSLFLGAGGLGSGPGSLCLGAGGLGSGPGSLLRGAGKGRDAPGFDPGSLIRPVGGGGAPLNVPSFLRDEGGLSIDGNLAAARGGSRFAPGRGGATAGLGFSASAGLGVPKPAGLVLGGAGLALGGAGLAPRGAGRGAGLVLAGGGFSAGAGFLPSSLGRAPGVAGVVPRAAGLGPKPAGRAGLGAAAPAAPAFAAPPSWPASMVFFLDTAGFFLKLARRRAASALSNSELAASSSEVAPGLALSGASPTSTIGAGATESCFGLACGDVFAGFGVSCFAAFFAFSRLSSSDSCPASMVCFRETAPFFLKAARFVAACALSNNELAASSSESSPPRLDSGSSPIATTCRAETGPAAGEPGSEPFLESVMQGAQRRS